jgi:hypothetical protein
MRRTRVARARRRGEGTGAHRLPHRAIVAARRARSGCGATAPRRHPATGPQAGVAAEMRPRAEEGRPGDAPTSSLRVTHTRPAPGRFRRPRAGDLGRCGKARAADRQTPIEQTDRRAATAVTAISLAAVVQSRRRRASPAPWRAGMKGCS